MTIINDNDNNKITKIAILNKIIIIIIIRFHNGLSLPGWLRKLSVRYLQNIPQVKRNSSLTTDSQVQLVAFTWRNCLEQTGEWEKGEKLAPSNQCSGQDEIDSIGSSHPRRRQISDLKTRADRALEPWQTTCLVETTQIMVWMDDALQPWTTNHLVEVTETMIPATRRCCVDRGEWPLRYEFTNHGT